MTAIVLAIVAAACFGGGIVVTQFGLRHVHPLSGAAISIPTFTLLFLIASPIFARRRNHRLVCGADLRRRRPGVSGASDAR